MYKTAFIIAICFVLASCSGESSSAQSPIEKQEVARYASVGQIPCPEGFTRTKYDSASFAAYLRKLELKTKDNLVYLYDGSLKGNQTAQFAVISMDVGNKDLQQCADAVMRLRGEYLFAAKKYNEIHFNFLSDGKPRYFKDYANRKLTYPVFRKYMDYIFSYANTGSLKKELKPVVAVSEIRPGDVFIQSGNPYGHAVIVVDVASDSTGKKMFMIAQSYMPAQEIHILKNPSDPDLSPWYPVDFGEILDTPEWQFTKSDLRRFSD